MCITILGEQDTVVLWSKSSDLDREIRGSNLGREPEHQNSGALKTQPCVPPDLMHFLINNVLSRIH